MDCIRGPSCMCDGRKDGKDIEYGKKIIDLTEGEVAVKTARLSNLWRYGQVRSVIHRVFKEDSRYLRGSLPKLIQQVRNMEQPSKNRSLKVRLPYIKYITYIYSLLSFNFPTEMRIFNQNSL